MLMLAGLTQAVQHPYPLSIPTRPGQESPVYRRGFVNAADAARLCVHEWSPPGRAAGRPVILFVHGIGMHGEPYAAVAAGWTARDLIFVVPDLRGHGRSEGEHGEMVEAPVLRSDLNCLLDWITQRHPGSPVILVGDSMGGLIAADYARHEQKRLAGLILMVPAFKVHPSRLKNPKGLGQIFRTGRIPIDTTENLQACTRVTGFIRAKQSDWLVTHEVSNTYLIRLARWGGQWPEAAAELKLPLLFCVGSEDQIIDNQAARAVFDRAATPAKQKTWKEWTGACHTLFWDPLTPEVVEYMARWAEPGRR
jgi:alpha-beta hydrolase superfamily lysophospholipase